MRGEVGHVILSSRGDLVVSLRSEISGFVGYSWWSSDFGIHNKV